MFLKNHFAGNAKGNLLLALKVDIARTEFLVFSSDAQYDAQKNLMLDISDQGSSGGDIYQRGIERVAFLTSLHIMHFYRNLLKTSLT